MNNAEDFAKYPLDSTSLSNGFSRIWESYGNTSSSELKESWKVIFETFNKCCIRNVSKSEKKYFVIPAVTGSGKTLCYQWYAAELAKATLSGDIDTPPGMMIITKLKNESDIAVEKINEWAGGGVSVAYNTTSKLKGHGNERKLDDYQIVVITHEYFKRHHHLKSVNKGVYKQVSSYKGARRNIVVIDESIEMIEHIEITREGLSKLGSGLYKFRDVINKESELITYLDDNYNELFYINNKEAYNRISNQAEAMIGKVSKGLKITKDSVVKLLEMNNSISLLNESEDSDSKDNIDLANNIKYLLDSELYQYRSGNKVSYRTSTLELPLQSLSILDATASVNKIYKDFPFTQVVSMPRVKVYNNVTLNCLRLDGNSDLGKETFKSNAKIHNENLFELTVFKDKSVIFTHKILEDNLSRIDRKYTASIDHFGNLTGVNTYKDCDNIFIYGISYQPRHVYIDNLIQSGKEIINENIIELQYSSISASIIQMINRGSCRKIVKGNAPVMKVAMLMPKNKSLSKVIVNYIKEEMTGIYVTNVDSDLIMSDNVNIKAGRLVDSDHDLIECITNANAKRIKLSEAFRITGITTKKKQDRVRKQMGDRSTKLGSELYDAGYKLVKDGQYQVIKG